MASNKNARIWIYALVLFGILAFFVSLTTGHQTLTLSHLFQLLIDQNQDTTAASVLRWIRIPRSASAYSVGFLLAISGCILQAILKNPLADAYTLGLSGGSALGAVSVLYLNLAPIAIWVPLASNVGALFAVMMVLVLAKNHFRYESRSLVLVGVMVSLFLGALSVFLISLLPPEKSGAAMTWFIGEFGSSRDLWIINILLITLPLVGLLFFKSSVLDALSLGDYGARSMGHNPQRARILLILCASVLAAAAISVAGLIGFIGLVSAHLARLIFPTLNHKIILPLAGLIGGLLLLSSDILGRAISPQTEIPAGSFAAILGAPVLIYILLRKRHARSE